MKRQKIHTYLIRTDQHRLRDLAEHLAYQERLSVLRLGQNIFTNVAIAEESFQKVRTIVAFGNIKIKVVIGAEVDMDITLIPSIKGAIPAVL